MVLLTVCAARLRNASSRIPVVRAALSADVLKAASLFISDNEGRHYGTERYVVSRRRCLTDTLRLTDTLHPRPSFDELPARLMFDDLRTEGGFNVARELRSATAKNRASIELLEA